MPQLQCYPVSVVWQPGVLAQQPPANFVAVSNGILAYYPLVSIFTLAVDLQDGTGYRAGDVAPALTGITGPLNGWQGVPPTYSSDPAVVSEGSAIFTGIEGALRADTFGMLNPASIGIRLWFKFSNKTGAQRLVNYAAIGGGTIFTLRYSSVADRLNWHILDSGQTHEVIVTAAALGSPAVDVWHHVYCYYDANAKRAGIQVRPFGTLGPFVTDEAAVPFGKNTSGGQFNVAYGPLNERFKGKLYAIAIWNRPLNFLEIDRVSDRGGWAWPVFVPAAGEASVEVVATTPAAPTDLVTSGSLTDVTVDGFTDNTDGIYEHEVWISDVTGRNWDLVGTLEAGDNSANFQGYNYYLQSVRVRAIGRGNPSDWATAYAPEGYYFAYGAVLLKADDAQWYYVQMSTDAEGVTTVDFGDDPPTPQAAPPYGAEFLSLLIGATPWGAHLVFDQDGHLGFEFIEDGEASALAAIPLASDNGSTYNLSLGLDVDNNPTAIPSQTPVDS